jgi:hypothetical protein
MLLLHDTKGMPIETNRSKKKASPLEVGYNCFLADASVDRGAIESK